MYKTVLLLDFFTLCIMKYYYLKFIIRLPI